MGGSHDHGGATGAEPARPLPRRVRTVLIVGVVPFVLATVAGLVLLWPATPTATPDSLGPPAALIDGTVVTRDAKPCLGAEDSLGCATVVIRLTEGPERGQQVSIDANEGPGSVRLRVGAPVVLSRSDDPQGTGQPIYAFADFQRRTPLLVLGSIFAVMVVLLGRWRGLAALAALGVSLLIIIRFVLPALLAGESPLLVAIVGSAAVMFLALYLTHGPNAQTTTAVLGTMVSLALTAVLGTVFVAAARFTGLATEEAGFLQASAGQVDLRGLLLAGIVIGSLGVLDDVTVTQASAVWQLHRAAPDAGPRAIYRAALHIGRDHIASTVNTLVLAYAGASLPLLVLFTLSSQPLGAVLSGEIVAEEVVRTLVGSIGLVASVPITTGLAAWVVTRSNTRAGAGADAGGEVDPASIDAWLRPPPEIVADAPPTDRRRFGRRRRRKPRGDQPLSRDAWGAPDAEREFWGDTE